MDGYTLSISRCSGGDGVEESFKAKINRREAALDAFAVAEAYCKGIFIDSKRGGNRAAPWQEGKTMSTPSVTILKNLVLNWKSNQMEEETIATFYRHWDGYPSCHAIDIANSLVVASRTKPEHIDFSGASVERDILNNRNWCQHFLKAMCMADADIEFIGEDNVPSASYTYVVTGAYDNFGGKVSIGAEEYLSRINIKVYEGDENGNLVFEGGAAECLAWADGYCGHC